MIKDKEFKITDKETCPVCKDGWWAYSGDYDSLCTKHYLDIEPTGDVKEDEENEQ